MEVAMISVPFATALTASVLSTSFISGVFGMAGGMILIGFLLAFMPLAPAMALHGITQIAANAARAWLWRQHISWPIVARYAAGALLAVLAVALGPVTPTKPMALIFIGLVSLVGLGLPARWTPNVMDNSHAVGCGTLCTVLHLTCGVSGPMLDLFFVRADLGTRCSPEAMRFRRSRSCSRSQPRCSEHSCRGSSSRPSTMPASDGGRSG
jgi:uncharacterized membrane protein YfcA